MQKEDESQAFWLKYLWGSLDSADLVPPPWDRAGTQSCVSRSFANACPPGIMTPVPGSTTGACLLGVGGHTGGRAKGLSWSSFLPSISTVEPSWLTGELVDTWFWL